MGSRRDHHSYSGVRDALVSVPTSLVGLAAHITPEQEHSPEEIMRMVMEDNRLLSQEVASLRKDIAGARRDLRELGDAASAISSIALSLTRVCLDNTAIRNTSMGAVVIPREVHQRMLGASIQLSNTPQGDIYVSIKERGPERVVVT